MNWHTCWLCGMGHTCGGGYHRHHLINKSKVPQKLRNQKAMRENLNKLLVPVCGKANVSRIADSRWAQKILLERLSDAQGEDSVKLVFEEILSKFKVRPHEFEYHVIMAGPDPPCDT